MRLSANQLEIIRTRPQQTKLYLSIFQPTEVFRAQINDPSITRGAMTITFDNVTMGAVENIEANFTMIIGTTAGGKDVGKIRVRSVSGSSMVVSENSNISWADNLYISVLRYVELWPVFPRIINDPNNTESVIFFKDWNIPYTNANSILGTFPCAGDHQAKFKGEQVYYSNTGTSNLLGDTLNHNWAFEGGTPTGSSSATPGFVTYNTPGHYVTRYVVSGSSGGVDTTYRYVSVYDKPGEGSSPPIERWEVSGLGGSRDEGGFKATFRVHKNIPLDENSVVVLFSEDWYGSTKQSLGGNSPNNEKIFFVGHILRNTIRYDYERSFVEFEVGSITEVMKDALGFSVSVESKASPTTWYELLDMDCRRAMYHYLRWHTTALSIADFQFVGDDRKIQFFDADRASMFDAIDNLMRNTLIGKVVSDRQGKIWAEVDAKAYSNPTGSFSSVMEITKRDWMGEPSFDERFSDELSYLEMGGIAYSGVSTGTFSALLACAPGSAPSFRGSIDMPEGLALLGQAQLNQLVGNLYANANSRLPKIDMEMAISARNLDIAPQETVHMNILASDTVRGKAVDGLYVPARTDWNYNPKDQILLPSVGFENLVSGPAGETVGIPESAEDAGFDSGFSVPQLQIPPLPKLTFPPSFAGLTTGSSCCDYLGSLGLGLGVYSCLYKRVSATPALGSGENNFLIEYASNPSMYEPSTGHMLLQNTGTITYNISVEGDWLCTVADVFPFISQIGLIIELYSSGGAVLDTVFDYFVGGPSSVGSDAIASGAGSSGAFSEVVVKSSSIYKKPAYMRIYIQHSTSPPTFQIEFSNIRITVDGAVP